MASTSKGRPTSFAGAGVDVGYELGEPVWSESIERRGDGVGVEEPVDVVEVPTVLEQGGSATSHGGVVDGRDLLQQRPLGREHVHVEGGELLPGVLGFAELGDRILRDHRPVSMKSGGIGAAAATEFEQHPFLQAVAGSGSGVVVGRVPLDPGVDLLQRADGLGQLHP